MFDDSATLKAFFSIPRKQIDHDLAHAETNFERNMQAIRASRAMPRESRSPEIEAQENHLQMVRG